MFGVGYRSTEHYMILKLTACVWVYREKKKKKQWNKKQTVSWHPEKKINIYIFWVCSFWNKCKEEEWVTGETMTGGTDFVGKYSALPREKDVAVSDRPWKQRSCQTWSIPVQRRLVPYSSVLPFLHSFQYADIIPCRGHYGLPSLFPESARAHLVSFLWLTQSFVSQ